MQLRYLKFSGIGPFPGTHEIDFDQLGENGLFLLEGPTGSGKSSIIDAIVFALYGSVASTEGGSERVRSTHADPRTESIVELVFTVSSGTYLVQRVPRYQRAKSRGTGTTLDNGSTKLFTLSEAAVDEHDWDSARPFSAHPKDSPKEIIELIGLTREQFIKTVVLPQGEFANFLRESVADRSAILERLFQTGRYRGVQEYLAEAARTATKSVEAAQAALRSKAEAWLGNRAISDESAEAVRAQLGQREFDVEALGELFAAEEARLSGVADGLDRDAAAAAARLSEANAQLSAAQKLSASLAERATLVAKLATLEEQAAEVKKAGEAVDLHAEASGLSTWIDRKSKADSALDEAREAVVVESLKLGEHETTLTDLLVPTRAEGVTAPALAAEAELGRIVTELGEQIGALDSASEIEDSLPSLKSMNARTADELAAVKGERVHLDTLTLDLPNVLAQRTQDLAEARAAAEPLGRLESELAGVEALALVAQDLDKAVVELPKADARLAAAKTYSEAATAELRSVTATWMDSVAPQLAKSLEDGAPCPVCGSEDHPSPAHPGTEFATQDDVAAAQAKVDAALRAFQKAADESTRRASNIASLKNQLGDSTAASIAARTQELKAQVSTATTASLRIPSLERGIANANADKDKLAAQTSANEATQAQLAAAYASEAKEIKKAEKAVAKARGTFASVADRVAELRRQRTVISQAKAAAESYRLAAQACVDSSSELDAKVAESSFDDVAAAQAALLSPATAAELKRTVEQHAKSLTETKARLDAPAIAELSGDEDPQLDQRVEAASTAKEASESASSAATLAKSGLEDARRLRTGVDVAAASWLAVQEDSGSIVRLAALANGQAPSRTQTMLSTWVLMRRFEAVLDRANEYVAVFSRGRYELERTDSVDSRKKKLGLDIQIVDHEGSPEGDTVRAPKTLSGGETFYVSLSLALALAESVQEDNGGIQIDTLLIDEGFGTLDEATRDDVMQTLTSLTESGRTVGIISHVEGLKTRIPNRVTITPIGNGASTLTVTA